MKAEFIDFLVQNKAYRQFMYNLAYCEKGCYGWDKYSYDTPASEWLACAFFWDESAEDHDFWQALDDKWQDIIN